MKRILLLVFGVVLPYGPDAQALRELPGLASIAPHG